MCRKKRLEIYILLLVLYTFVAYSLVLYFVNDVYAQSSPKTWIVDASGNGDYFNIQEAINVANSGDTIRILAGNYGGIKDFPDVIVNKMLKIEGSDRQEVIVRTNIRIKADGTSLSNLTVMKTINLEHIRNITLYDLNIEGYLTGHLADSTIINVLVTGTNPPNQQPMIIFADNLQLRNSVIEGPNWGIGLDGSRIFFSTNRIKTKLTVGVYEESFGTQILNNELQTLLIGGRYDTRKSPGIIVRNNNIKGDISIVFPVYDVKLVNNIVDGSILADASYAGEFLVDGNTLKGISLSFESLNNLTIMKNILTSLEISISNKRGTNIYLYLNKITNSAGYGIEVKNAEKVYIIGNDIVSSKGGIHLVDTQAIVTTNNLVNNELQAHDEGHDNLWYYLEAGNFWSNWKSANPFPIPGPAGSVDRYPLAMPANLTISSIPSELLPDFLKPKIVSVTSVSITSTAKAVVTTIAKTTEMATPAPKVSGFGTVYVIGGLLATAYLLQKQRSKYLK